MGLGLCGASRSGKSTLARAWSETHGVNYVTLSTVEVLKSIGFDCKEIVTVDDRITAQKAMVKRAYDVFTSANRTNFVSDRTPLDIAAYMLADIPMAAELTDRQHRMIGEIVEDCFDITNQCFRGLLLLPPVLPYVEEEGKPRENPSYSWHFHYLIHGLAASSACKRPFWSLAFKVIDLGQRVNALTKIYMDMLENDIHTANGSELH